MFRNNYLLFCNNYLLFSKAEKERVHTVQDSIRPPKAKADWVNLYVIVLQNMFWITVEKEISESVSTGDTERLSFHQSPTLGHYRRQSVTIPKDEDIVIEFSPF